MSPSGSARLKPIDANLWTTEQPLRFLGLEVGTRMTVIRLEDNSLCLISPIQITTAIKEQLDRLGTVTYLIAPNLFHYLYLTQAQVIYPNAKIFAPPGIESKLPNLTIDQIFTKDEVDFISELEYTLLEGFQAFIINKIAVVNEVVFYHPSTKTLIITDSAFNFDDSFPLITQFAARLIGSYQTLKPSRLEKIAVQDKEKLTSAINKVVAWDFQRVIMGHGKIVDRDAKIQLTQGYNWLVK